MVLSSKVTAKLLLTSVTTTCQHSVVTNYPYPISNTAHVHVYHPSHKDRNPQCGMCAITRFCVLYTSNMNNRSNLGMVSVDWNGYFKQDSESITLINAVQRLTRSTMSNFDLITIHVDQYETAADLCIQKCQL